MEATGHLRAPRPRDPPAPPHAARHRRRARSDRRGTPRNPPGSWRRCAQPPPLPPGHRATPLGHDFDAGVASGARHDMPSAAHRERAQNLEETSQEGSRERAERARTARSARRARTRASSSTTLERARASRAETRRDDSSAFTFDGFGTTVHSPRPRRCDIEGARESSPAVAVLRARRADATAPFGETRVAAAKARFDAAARPSAARTRSRAARRRARRVADRATARPRAAAVAAASCDVRARGGPSRGHRQPRGGRPRATARGRSRGGGGGGGGGTVGGRRVQSGPGDLARARARREAPRVRGGHARTTDRGGERNAAEAKRALRRRVWRGTKARRAAERTRPRLGRGARFWKQDGGVALGAVMGAVPAPPRLPPLRA